MLAPDYQALLHLRRDLTHSKISLIHTISTSPAHGIRPPQIGQEVRRSELLIDDLREMVDGLQDHRRAFDSKAALWRLGRACKTSGAVNR